mgnify:CR=1 FL=1
MEEGKIIETFEALLEGYMPSTGECIEDNIIINDRLVIRSLQAAIIKLQSNISKKEVVNEELISDDDYYVVYKLFKSNNINPTKNRFRKFFAGKHLSVFSKIDDHYLYGKYESSLTGMQIYKCIQLKWKEFNISKVRSYQPKSLDNITTEQIIELNKNKINNLPLVKNPNNNPQILKSRKIFSRAYEPWSYTEDIVLKDLVKAKIPNKQISIILKRGLGSIESRIRKIS